MALYTKQECVICGQPVGMNGSKLTKDRWICPDCLNKAGGLKEIFKLKKMSDDEIKAIIGDSSSAAVEGGFNPTIKIGNYMYIDKMEKKVQFPKVSLREAMQTMRSNQGKERIFYFSDIVGYELLENGTSVTKGGLGAAVAGGALFGGVGAVTGGVIGKKKTATVCESLQVKVTLNDMSRPALFIDLLQTKVRNNSLAYKNAMEIAQKMLSALQLICDENGKSNEPERNATSAADEIKKYKELLDMGAITEGEYEQKKKQLLGL